MCTSVDPQTLGEIRRQKQRRRNEKKLRSRESVPEHGIPAHELYKESEDRVGEEIDLEQIALHPDAWTPVDEQPNEHGRVKGDLVEERRMEHDARYAVG